MKRRHLLVLAASVWLLSACASTQGAGGGRATKGPAPDYAALVTASDRTQADLDLDASRKPTQLLRFMDVRLGQVVADLGAGNGYTTELLARAVGPTGKVYAQNPAIVIDRFAKDTWPARLARSINSNVVRVDQEFDAPLPPEAKNLDAVIMNLFYHDLYWFGTDRAAMNQAIFRALKPGGIYVIIDHSAGAGSGVSEVKTLHRIEEKIVRDDVLAAGFRLHSSAEFLGNPDDTRDWMVFEEAKRGATDRFVLKFVKP